MASERRLSVVVDPSRAQSGSRVVRRSLDDVQNAAHRTESAMGGLSGTVRLLGSAFAALGAAQGLRYAISQFSAFESGLVGVGKTTNIAGRQLEALGLNVQEMARELPVATNQLLDIAQAAGQLGVSGSDDIMTFTRTVGQLGLASDLAGEQAATSLARILTVTDEAIGNVDRLGSTMVRLGNNMAATESEIAGATTRVAQATAQFGATADEVTGIGAALVAVGVQAEAGGTVIGRAFQSINDAVRQGGEELTAFTRITGMTADALRTMFQEDPTAAFQAFVEGLGQINAQGGDVTAALSAVGLEGTRVAQVLGTMATRSDVLGEALSMANDEWQANTALTEEALVASQSFSSQMQLTANALDETAAMLGQALAPAIVAASEGFRDNAEVVANLIRYWSGYGDQLGDAYESTQQLASVIERLGVYTATAITSIVAYRAGIAAARLVTLGWAASLDVLKTALIRIGIGAAVVAAGELIYQFTNLVSHTGSVGQAFTLLGEVAAGVWNGIVGSAAGIPAGLASVWAAVQADFGRMVRSIQQMWNAMLAQFEVPLLEIGGQTIIEGIDLSGYRADVDATTASIAALQAQSARAGEAALQAASDGFEPARQALGRLRGVMQGIDDRSLGPAGREWAATVKTRELTQESENAVEPLGEVAGGLDDIAASASGIGGGSSGGAAGGISEAQRALEDFLGTADRLAEKQFPGEFARREAEELAAALQQYGGALDDFQRQAVEARIADQLEAARLGVRELEDETARAGEGMADTLQNTLGDVLGSLFDGPMEDLDAFVDDVFSAFARIGQANLQSAFDGLFGSQSAGMVGKPQAANDNGSWWETLFGATKEGTQAGSAQGSASGLASVLGNKGMANVSAGIGGLGLGYQSQSPLTGGLGGAVSGFAAGGPIGAIIGGIGGLIGGLFGSSNRRSQARNEARDKLDQQREAIEQLNAAANGEIVSNYAQQLAEMTTKLNEAADLARKAGDRGLYRDIRDARGNLRGTLGEDFREELERSLNALRGDEYLNTASDALEQFETRLKDAKELGVSSSGAMQELVLTLQAMSDEAELSQAQLDGLADRMPELADALDQVNVIAAMTAKEIERATRSLQDRIFAATTDTDTRAGALAAFDRRAAQERADTVEYGAELVKMREKALALERAGIMERFAEQEIAAAEQQAAEQARIAEEQAENMRGLQDRIFQAANDNGTRAGALAAFERQAARERLETADYSLDLIVAREKALAAERLNVVADFAQQTLDVETSRLTRAYTDLSSKISDAANGFERFIRQIGDFRRSLRLDDNLSPLSARERLGEARSEFERIRDLALSGDTDAQAKLQESSQNLLDESRSYHAASEAYYRDFEMVQSVLESSEIKAGQQLTAAEKQQQALDDQYGKLIDIDSSIISTEMTIAEGMDKIREVMGDFVDAQAEVDRIRAEQDARDNYTPETRDFGFNASRNRALDGALRNAGLDYQGDFVAGEHADWIQTLTKSQRKTHDEIKRQIDQLFGRGGSHAERNAAFVNALADSGIDYGGGFGGGEFNRWFARLSEKMQDDVNAIRGPIDRQYGFGFANGGYTGPGGMYEPRGTVHAGEIIWSQADIARGGGVAAVEAMRTGGVSRPVMPVRMPGNDNSGVERRLDAVLQENREMKSELRALKQVVGLSSKETTAAVQKGNDQRAEMVSQNRKALAS